MENYRLNLNDDLLTRIQPPQWAASISLPGFLYPLKFVVRILLWPLFYLYLRATATIIRKALAASNQYIPRIPYFSGLHARQELATHPKLFAFYRLLKAKAIEKDINSETLTSWWEKKYVVPMFQFVDAVVEMERLLKAVALTDSNPAALLALPPEERQAFDEVMALRMARYYELDAEDMEWIEADLIS